MRVRLLSVILLLSLWLLVGCGKTVVVQPDIITENRVKTSPQSPEDVVLDEGKRGPMPILSETVTEKMYSQYQQWRGIRYKRGGMSKNGIDCSGLVCLIFNRQFGISLPRTVRQQAQKGVQIERKELHSGDLVFFKTGNRSYHVGIYIEDGKFFHVSSSNGVMISTLDDTYWKAHYWQSRRINGA